MKKSFFKLFGLLMIAVLVASCSKTSDLLEMVPNDALAVGIIKPNELAKKADFENADLSKLPAEKVNKIKALFAGEWGVNTEEVVFFVTKDNLYFCFEMPDIEKFKAATEAELTVEDGFNVLKVHRDVIVEKDGMAWAVDRTYNRDYIAEIKKFMNLDAANSVVSLPNFTDKMVGKDIAIFMNIGAMMTLDDFRELSSFPMYDKMHDAVCYMNLEAGKKEITLTSNIYDSAGNNLLKEFDMGKIDTDILEMIDAGSTAVYALHLNKEYLNQMRDILVAQSRNMMEQTQIQTIFSCIEGDIAVAGTFKNPQRFEGNDLTMIVKLKDNAQKEIQPFIDTMGFSPNAEGEYLIPWGEFMIHAAFKDDYLYVSTTGLPSKGFDDNKYASNFKDKTAAIFVDATAGSPLSSFLQTVTKGIKVDGYLQGGLDDELKITLHLENEDSNILAAILSAALESM